MTDYVIGDIQGCLGGLDKLLTHIGFNPQQDKLIAVGDLVARGENSLGVLELCYSLGDSFTSVLGNHDLHLLTTQAGLKEVKPSDKLKPLLQSNKIKQYIDWIRHYPLAYQYDDNTLICHAGLYPGWSFNQALRYSDEIQLLLQQPDFAVQINKLYGNQPYSWHSKLTGKQRLRFIINAFTRMRYVTEHGALDFNAKMQPSVAPANIKPWFQQYNPHLTGQQRVLFGHWASLLGQTNDPRFIALDTGYVWGNSLTCFNLTHNTPITIQA
jgi:bis(5'-nucleosyl)-tetraphosphatase (symmetrical)